MLSFLDHNLTKRLTAKRHEYAAAGWRVQEYQSFVYAADFLPILANTTMLDNVTIDQDSDFLVCMQTFSAFSTAGASLAAPNILLKLTSDAVARDLQSQQIHVINCFGTGERPFIYYEPLELPAKSNLSVEAQNISATDTNLRLSFIGVKVYKVRMDARTVAATRRRRVS